MSQVNEELPLVAEEVQEAQQPKFGYKRVLAGKYVLHGNVEHNISYKLHLTHFIPFLIYSWYIACVGRSSYAEHPIICCSIRLHPSHELRR